MADPSKPIPPAQIVVGFSVDDSHMVPWVERCCDECYEGPFTYKLKGGA